MTMLPIRRFLAVFSITHGLLSACYAEPIPGELVVSVPTLAPPCLCTVDDGVCTCDVCDCKPTTKAEPVSVVKRTERIDATSPITLAPDPDQWNSALTQSSVNSGILLPKAGNSTGPEDPGMTAFKARWNEAGRKTYTEPVSKGSNPAAVASSSKATTAPPPLSITLAASSLKASTKPAAPPAINRAVMVFSCQNGVCAWRPAASQPTRQVVPQRTYRRGLFRR
jgi:hypothetical protein